MAAYLRRRDVFMHRAGMAATVVLLGWSGVLHAQPLDVFLDAAREYAPRLRSSRAEALDASLANEEVLVGLAPSLEVRARLIRNQFEAEIEAPPSPGSPPETFVILPLTQRDLEIRLGFPVVDVARWLRLGATRTAKEAAESQFEQATLDLTNDVVRAWSAVAGARAVAQATQAAIAASEELVRVSKERLDEGAATGIDLARAQSELAERQRLLADARARAELEAVNLHSLTGLRAGPFSLPEVSTQPEPSLGLWLEALDALPSVRAASLTTLAARREAQAAWASLLPRLDALAVQTFTNATGFANAGSFWTAQLVATLPLDPTTGARARRLAAQADLAQAQEDEVRLTATRRVSQAWHEVHRWLARLEAARAHLEAANTTARLVAERFDAGAATSLDVREARREALLAQAAVLRDEAELFAARCTLRLAAGLPWNAAGPEPLP